MAHVNKKSSSERGHIKLQFLENHIDIKVQTTSHTSRILNNKDEKKIFEEIFSFHIKVKKKVKNGKKGA